MGSYDLAIIGAGVMGASCACEAALAGARVLLIDQTRVPNPRAASIDHSKIFRFAYDDALYVGMAVEALQHWRQLEVETDSKLLTRTGMLLIGHQTPSFETETYDVMSSMGLDVELLSPDAVTKRFPQFAREAIPYAVFDPAGGILHAESAVRALLDLGRRRGVCVLESQPIAGIEEDGEGCSLITESGQKVLSSAVVVASGPWSRKLLPELASLLNTTRQEVFYFKADAQTVQSKTISFEASDFPVFAALDVGFYGFPIHHHGAMKIANHHKGTVVDPASVNDSVFESGIEACREFFSQYIPGLSSAQLMEGKVCVYNNTPDDDFIIDWHPSIGNTLIITGFSGHGFKFGPVIGKIASDLIMTNHSHLELDRFSLKRFQRVGV